MPACQVILPWPTSLHPACPLPLSRTRCSTVTGGLSYQESLGGGQRRGPDDRYAAEVGGEP